MNNEVSDLTRRIQAETYAIRFAVKELPVKTASHWFIKRRLVTIEQCRQQLIKQVGAREAADLLKKR
jgi:hypothetical protein